MNGKTLARDLFQTGLSRHSDMDVEAGLPQFTQKRHSVLHQVADLVINEENSWYGLNRRHGTEKANRRAVTSGFVLHVDVGTQPTSLSVIPTTDVRCR